MKASLLYRITGVLLALFAAAHTLGFSQTDPQWGLDEMLRAMRSIHFDALGTQRTYWDFFMGAGVIVGVQYLFAAILSWLLGGLPDDVLARMRAIAWSFALCFAVITILSWAYLFIIPISFSAVITACLIVAAALIPKATPAKSGG